jgi:hypothetical protein
LERVLVVDLAVVSANNVWAVGWDISHSVIEHWGENDWSVVPSP